jgi:hypothetical protein
LVFNFFSFFNYTSRQGIKVFFLKFEPVLTLPDKFENNLLYRLPMSLNIKDSKEQCEATFVPLLPVLQGNYVRSTNATSEGKNASVILDVKLRL